MKKWPIAVCRLCGRVAPTTRDLLIAGCEGKPEKVIPFEIGEKLNDALEYAANDMCADMQVLGPALDLYKEEVESGTRD